MANAKICDRCGAVINPPSSKTGLIVYVGSYPGGKADEFELCVSCAWQLKKLLRGEKVET